VLIEKTKGIRFFLIQNRSNKFKGQEIGCQLEGSGVLLFFGKRSFLCQNFAPKKIKNIEYKKLPRSLRRRRWQFLTAKRDFSTHKQIAKIAHKPKKIYRKGEGNTDYWQHGEEIKK